MTPQTPPRLDDANFERLAAHIQGLLEQVEQLPFPAVQADMYELLNCIDLLHREALTRLLEMIESHAPHLRPVLEQDNAVHSLLLLYNFLESDAAPAAPASGAFIPLAAVDVIQPETQPVWVPAGRLGDLPSGQLMLRQLEGTELLLCRVEDAVYAFQRACLDSVLPLDYGALDGTVLTCPWHGCHYDVATGRRLDESGRRLETYPVLIGEDGALRVGFNVPDHMMPVRGGSSPS